MEDKQLNFNQPLLSVRRFSSTPVSQKDERRKTKTSLPTIPPIPSYKRELNSGPLTNPGSIPFVWEKSPGRPKDETKPQVHAKERPPNVPKLPPGRTLKPKMQDLDIISEDTRDSLGTDSVLSVEEKLSTFEISKETKEVAYDSRDDDDNETYMDALDTLSRSETFYNCSVSGVSGLDSDVKPSTKLSSDPKTRDFMMSRFLPAAKAMASEVPQHAHWKQPVVKEKPQDVKKLENKDNMKPKLRYGPNFLQDCGKDNNEAEEKEVQEEESDHDCDEYGHVSSKACGLLPRFCFRGSFGLLNPVPGLSMRTRLPTSPARRTHAGSSSASSYSETKNEPARLAIYEHRSLGGSPLARHQEGTRVVKNEYSENSNQNNCQKLPGSGLHNSSQGPTDFSQTPVSQQKDSISRKKGLASFKELLADENDRDVGLQSQIVEKTLYVDTVHKVESPKANSCSLDTERESNLKENNTGMLKDLNIATEPLEWGLVANSAETEKQIGFREDTKIDLESYAPGNTEVIDNNNSSQHLKVCHGSLSEFPPPPPLPKSPSDSWLWRTLPSVTSKNASLRSNAKTPASIASGNDSKWDKTVQL